METVKLSAIIYSYVEPVHNATYLCLLYLIIISRLVNEIAQKNLSFMALVVVWSGLSRL